MERRIVGATVVLVVSLAALAVAGLYLASTPDPGTPVPTQQAQDFLAPEGPVERTVLPGGVLIAWRALAPGGMSGEFAPTKLAFAGALRAPSVYVLSDLVEATNADGPA